VYSIAEIANHLRQRDPESVIGIEPDQIRQIQDAWGISELPSAYGEFLTRMGASAGRLLCGTDAFYPAIMEMQEWAKEFFEENAGRLLAPNGGLVFAMHQGYVVYWMTDISRPDPEVVLCTEGQSAPLRVWPSFTAFLNSHFLDEPGTK
jgi:hypothetical protein